MYKKLKIELATDKIDFRKSSCFQGALFELMDTDYVSILHQQNRHPYSQYVYKDKGKVYWTICTCDDDSSHYMMNPIMDDSIQQITLNKEKEPISFVSKQLKMVSQEQLMDHFYNKPAERYLEIRILTPMSFKSYGRYINYPDLRLIYQSLMNKYDSVLKEASMFDEDTLDMLVEGSEIVKYNLRSYLFPLQGVKIPSFFGTMTIKVTSTDTAAKFIRLLLEFGEYSGVGIKTGLGMGAIQIVRRDNE